MLKRVFATLFCLALVGTTATAQNAVDFRDALRMTFPATVSVTTPEQAAEIRAPFFGQGDLPGLRQEFRFVPGQRFAARLPGLGDIDSMNRPTATAGFAISANKILTQLRGDESEITVTTIDKSEHDGKVIARDHVTGLAVVQVDNAELVSLVVGDGNPEAGLPVVTTWIANGVGTSKGGMIACPPNASQPSIGFTQQIDTSAQMHVAGSPVVDSAGVLVGMTVAAEDGSIVCVPAVQLNRLIDLGLGDEPKDLKRGLIGIQFNPETGAVVNNVSPGSAGEEAGLLVGDSIEKVNDYPVANYQDVIAAVAMARSGDALEITLTRGDETMVRNVTLRDHPQRRVTLEQMPNNNAVVQQQAWQLKDGKLVPLDLDKDGGADVFMAPGMKDMFQGLELDALPGQFRFPKRLNGFRIERTESEKALREAEAKIKELTERMKELEAASGQLSE